jgi:hypothetical protein
MWFQLCSCMDVLGDTELAIESHFNDEHPASYGAHYLGVYGLLQALFIQQDAVTHLAEALSIPVDIRRYPRLVEIREIRNASIGHPTKQDRRGSQPTAFHFISRPTLSRQGFHLLSFDGAATQMREIDLAAAVEDQHRYVSDILSAVIAKLEEDETAHKEKFKMEKLENVFSDTLNYQIEKLYEGLRNSSGYPIIGQGSLDFVSGTFDKFKQALEDRGTSYKAYAGLEYFFDDVDYAISKLRDFYTARIDGIEPELEEQAAVIFIFFLSQKLKELQGMANEIDDEYVS